MTRTRRSFRLAWRNPTVRTWRTLNRPAVRSLPGHRRGPDDLSQALAAFARAIRSHRRLAKLAPSFFDSAVVDRAARERDGRRWMALWEPALARAYGCVPSPRKPEDDLPPLSPPQTQRTVDRQLACWNLCFNLGREALRRHQQRRPHELISFARLARLIELASDLKRWASGCDAGLADPQPANHDAAWADLKRAYGHLSSHASSGPGSPLPLAAREPNPASNIAPVQSSVASSAAEMHPAKANLRPPSADPAPCPAAPIQQAPYRCDAWSRWARHMRRSGGRGHS